MFGHGSFTMGSIIKSVTAFFSTQFDYEQVISRAVEPHHLYGAPLPTHIKEMCNIIETGVYRNLLSSITKNKQ
jgi:hypothetical protein